MPIEVLSCQQIESLLPPFVDGTAPADARESAQAEETIRTLYGRELKVPPGIESEGMTLVASLFIVPGITRPAAELSTLGHAEIVWSAGGKTYMLVAAAHERERLHRVASRFQVEAQ